ncbi:malonyl-ACP O-methyltransferase BioC [Brevibacillus sp. AY1]|uniref:malonyl-ACP O-methyltransferase BioC n=1 Tax=Brevibacillus sp. AY1 TaxID=2807621 RepID=UPI002457C09A|nr:malonyl-ACP O-methyltransferase BioC [Brevibacillus sp. AY1]MDH4619514.1 malonyl-ACP O-methyltransferase BioC [Brevibacillus sp. AY1]
MSDRLDTIRRRFSRSAAGDYDAHAHVQRAMAESLAEFVIGRDAWNHMENAKILEIGCGTGALTLMLRNVWPNAEITALDVAPAMLEAAKRRLRAAVPTQKRLNPDIQFLVADVEAWTRQAACGSFELIVSNACFQWLAHPQETLCELKRLLRPGGMLAFTTFGAETFRELHTAFELAYRAQGLKPQRHGLPLHTAKEWNAMLAAAGFMNPRRRQNVRIERYPTVRDFLHAIKAIGASASVASPSGRIGLRRLFHDMFQHYETRYGDSNGILATYELLLLHGFAPK